MSNGMLQASFIPPPPQRELRDLVRTHRKFTQERARQVQRIQKVLQGCNIKLDSVLADIAGASGLAIIRGIIAGESDPEKLANLVRGRIKAKLEGCRRSAFEMLDRPAMRPLPAKRYELTTWARGRVNIDYHVDFGPRCEGDVDARRAGHVARGPCAAVWDQHAHGRRRRRRG